MTRRAALIAAAGAALATATPASALRGTRAAVEAYLDAWRRRDLERIAASVHADVHFKSPNSETCGRDHYRAATGRFLVLVERVDVRAQFISGDRAMFAY